MVTIETNIRITCDGGNCWRWLIPLKSLNLFNFEQIIAEAGWLLTSDTDTPKVYCPSCRKTFQTTREDF